MVNGFEIGEMVSVRHQKLKFDAKIIQFKENDEVLIQWEWDKKTKTVPLSYLSTRVLQSKRQRHAPKRFIEQQQQSDDQESPKKKKKKKAKKNNRGQINNAVSSSQETTIITNNHNNHDDRSSSNNNADRSWAHHAGESSNSSSARNQDQATMHSHEAQQTAAHPAHACVSPSTIEQSSFFRNNHSSGISKKKRINTSKKKSSTSSKIGGQNIQVRNDAGVSEAYWTGKTNADGRLGVNFDWNKNEIFWIDKSDVIFPQESTTRRPPAASESASMTSRPRRSIDVEISEIDFSSSGDEVHVEIMEIDCSDKSSPQNGTEPDANQPTDAPPQTNDYEESDYLLYDRRLDAGRKHDDISNEALTDDFQSATDCGCGETWSPGAARNCDPAASDKIGGDAADGSNGVAKLAQGTMQQNFTPSRQQEGGTSVSETLRSWRHEKDRHDSDSRTSWLRRRHRRLSAPNSVNFSRHVSAAPTTASSPPRKKDPPPAAPQDTQQYSPAAGRHASARSVWNESKNNSSDDKQHSDERQNTGWNPNMVFAAKRKNASGGPPPCRPLEPPRMHHREESLPLAKRKNAGGPPPFRPPSHREPLCEEKSGEPALSTDDEERNVDNDSREFRAGDATSFHSDSIIAENERNSTAPRAETTFDLDAADKRNATTPRAETTFDSNAVDEQNPSTPRAETTFDSDDDTVGVYSPAEVMRRRIQSMARGQEEQPQRDPEALGPPDSPEKTKKPAEEKGPGCVPEQDGSAAPVAQRHFEDVDRGRPRTSLVEEI